jgi:hypothetical protein
MLDNVNTVNDTVDCLAVMARMFAYTRAQVDGDLDGRRIALLAIIEALDRPSTVTDQAWEDLKILLRVPDKEVEPTTMDEVLKAITDAANTDQGNFVQWRAVWRMALLQLRQFEVNNDFDLGSYLPVLDEAVGLIRAVFGQVPVAGEYVQLAADFYTAIRSIKDSTTRTEYILQVIETILSMIP